MRTLILLVALLLCALFGGCNHFQRDNANSQSNTNTSGSSSQTVDDIRKQKPTFPEFEPIKFHFDVSQPTHIRVVANSSHLQSVWMLYYDPDQHEWERLDLGKGSGDNQLIGETVFNKRYGITTTTQDPPEFYMTYSDDGGNTWKGHQIATAVLSCRIENPKASSSAQLLISADLNPNNQLPSVAILLQSANPRRMHDSARRDFTGLCNSFKEIQ